MALRNWLPIFASLLCLGSATCREGSSDGLPPAGSALPIADVVLPGINTAALTARERKEWSAQVSTLQAPCASTPGSIASCVAEGKACVACKPAAEFLLKEVQLGRPAEEREKAYRGRFDPAAVRTVATDGSPEKGSPDAPITIVEWADFQCGYCAMMYPVLEKLSQRFPSSVRVVFKHYPLSIHPHADPAARASIAAGKQGKFWPMHHRLFEEQPKLELQDLEQYAKDIGLDLAQFRKDLSADDTTARIAKDKAQAEQLGLDGTPMIFINGRLVSLAGLNEVTTDLEDWVKLELKLLGKSEEPPPPAPSSSASTAPRPSASAPR